MKSIRVFATSIVVSVIAIGSVEAASVTLAPGFDIIRLEPKALPSVVVNQTTVTNGGMGGSLENTTLPEVCGTLSTHMLGARGGDVAKVQAFLKEHIDTTLPVTGYYGARTVAAVKKFQWWNGLPVTGKQLAQTTARMQLLACGSLTPSSARLGAHGNNVIAIQSLLNTHGATLRTTGYFGKGTESAVRAFQTANGIPATGSVYEKTLAALQSEKSLHIGARSSAVSSAMTAVNTSVSPVQVTVSDTTLSKVAEQLPVAVASVEQTAAVPQVLSFAQTAFWTLIAAAVVYLASRFVAKGEVTETSA